MRTPQYIKEYTSAKAWIVTVLIYGKGDLRVGNKKYSSMKEVKKEYPSN